MQFKLDVEDWWSWIHKIPDASVDLIITDPPYSSINRHRYGTHQRLVEWFPTLSNNVYGMMLQQFHRILRDNRHIYIFCDEETCDAIKSFTVVDAECNRWFVDLPNAAKGSSLRYWKAIVWDKLTRGMGYHYANSHEYIMMFEKGKRALNTLVHKSILSCKSVSDPQYPTEKPVELARLLIANSTMPGMKVCDPFMGSGAFGVAALQSNCNFIGCDVKADAAELSFKRLSEIEK